MKRKSGEMKEKAEKMKRRRKEDEKEDKKRRGKGNRIMKEKGRGG
jgi:hypothetical protein